MRQRLVKRILAAAALALILPSAVEVAAQGLRSGPQVGERPLPFTSNMVTGPQRGRQYCYVCELKDEPAILVFARKADEPTARLLRALRDAVNEKKQEKLFGWLVFLSEKGSTSEAALERSTYQLARENSATAVPISVLGDPQGPPGYLISRDADVTVIAFRSGKVLANRTFQGKEWTPRAAEGVVKDMTRALLGGPAGNK